MALLDEIRKSEYLSLLGDRLQNLLDIPTNAARFMVNPTAVVDAVSGKTAMPREKGFAEGLAQLPQTENLSVLDPRNRAYMEGYSQGEPFGYAGMALPFASAGATKLSDKLVQSITGNPMATGAKVMDYAAMPFGNAIVSPQVARAINMPVTLPTDEVFQKAVANTPNASITDEGLLLNVMRKQKPQQAMTESVRGGVFYLPEGASQIKHYGGSTSYYGGTEKIAGETLFKNPLFVKGATGGKAPEAAYEELLGKDALAQMKDDAMEFSSRVFRPNISYGQAVEGVEEYLRKYAPDLEGYSSYIIDNSRKGNQLRYALQEVAVGQKVRDAGFDSVIGHSKKKGEPTISEIFDVRESHYPNAYGDFQLMPKFEGLLD